MTPRTLRPMAVLALLLVLALGAPAPAPAQAAQAAPATIDVDSLIEKNLDAKGGRDKIEAIETARVTGKMTMGPMEAPFVFEWKKPDNLRLEFTVQGMTGIQAYDGETGWQVMPFMGKTEPEKMSADEAEQIKEQADFGGPLLNPEEKGYELEYVGEEEIEGTPAYKLKVTKKNGDVSYLFLDKEFFVEIKQQGITKVQGQEIETATAIGDYKEVDGILFAHSYDMSSPAMPGGQNLSFDKIELNVELADDRFEMPAAAAKPADDGDGNGR